MNEKEPTAEQRYPIHLDISGNLADFAEPLRQALVVKANKVLDEVLEQFDEPPVSDELVIHQTVGLSHTLPCRRVGFVADYDTLFLETFYNSDEEWVAFRLRIGEPIEELEREDRAILAYFWLDSNARRVPSEGPGTPSAIFGPRIYIVDSMAQAVKSACEASLPWWQNPPKD